jgi:hypothetical protein
VNPIFPSEKWNEAVAKNINWQNIKIGALPHGRVVDEIDESCHFVRGQESFIWAYPNPF